MRLPYKRTANRTNYNSNYWNSTIHGLTDEDTTNEAVFAKVWEQIEPLIKGLPLVAHNKGFDEACLKAVFRTYRMDYPDYQFYCTLQESRRQLKHLDNHQLHTVDEACGYIVALEIVELGVGRAYVGYRRYFE